MDSIGNNFHTLGYFTCRCSSFRHFPLQGSGMKCYVLPMIAIVGAGMTYRYMHNEGIHLMIGIHSVTLAHITVV